MNVVCACFAHNIQLLGSSYINASVLCISILFLHAGCSYMLVRYGHVNSALLYSHHLQMLNSSIFYIRPVRY